MSQSTPAPQQPPANVEVIDKDALKNAIATKYGLILSDNDPIFHYLFMHDVILDQYQQFLIKAISAGQQKGQQQYLEQAKANGQQIASKTINAIAQVGNKHESNLKTLWLFGISREKHKM